MRRMEWGRSWLVREKTKMSVCVSFNPFSLTHTPESWQQGENIPSECFGSCVIVGRVLCCFFPPTLFSQFRPLTDCRKKTRGEGKQFVGKNYSRDFRRRKGGRTRKIFILYFILRQEARNRKGKTFELSSRSSRFARDMKIRILSLEFS